MAKNLKKEEDKAGASEWMTTYSDMMTILFVFFVLLFSMSSINPVKWDKLVQTYGNHARNLSAVGGGDVEVDGVEQELINILDDILSHFLEDITDEGVAEEQPEELYDEERRQIDFEHIYNVVSMYVDTRGYSDRIDVEKDEFHVMIRFKDRAFFTSGHAIISAEGQDIIKFISEAIQLVIEQVDTIKIEGHTDSMPQNSWEYPDNWALGSARANAVRSIFENTGIPADRRLMEVISLADTVPRAGNDTLEGRSENRRVEIYITRLDVVEEEAVVVEQVIVDLPEENAMVEESAAPEED